jgi:hypothetical protein
MRHNRLCQPIPKVFRIVSGSHHNALIIGFMGFHNTRLRLAGIPNDVKIIFWIQNGYTI